MRSVLAAAGLVPTALVVAATGAVAGEAGLDIIRPEEVRAGMKGYALTVFEGTEPEPFDVEVVGRLRRALPQQDVILVRCTDPKLRDMKVASGMSGSPVYVRGSGEAEGTAPARLMGALAYSWSFQIEAIAGVTPITNMLHEGGGPQREPPVPAPAVRARDRSCGPAPAVRARDRSCGPAPAVRARDRRCEPAPAVRARDGWCGPVPAVRARDRWCGPVPAAVAAGRFSGPLDYIKAAADPLWALHASRAGSPRAREAPPRAGPDAEGLPGGALTPLTTPLMVSGLPASCFPELRRQLAPLGLEPIQGGGGGSGGEASGGLRPGDAVGVQLVRGDSDWTAVGTVTHVDGNRVLAFGHPFIMGGAWEAPVTRADVQFILKRSLSSFKLANSGPVVGSLVDDRQACIAAELGRSAGMVPLEVEVTGEGRAARAFRYEIVRHPFISGMLTFWALVDSMYAAYPWRDDSTVTVRQRIELQGHPPLEIGTVELTSGLFSYSMIRPLAAALYNPFERAKLARLSYRVHVEPRNRSARIVSVRADAPEVKPGAEVTLHVKIRPFGEEDAELPFTVRVPEEPRKGSFSISFHSGSGVAPDIPTPRNLDEYLEAIRVSHTYSADQLVAVYVGQTRGLMAEGKVLPALPASIKNVLAPAGSEGAASVVDRVLIPVKTRWVLTGRAGISLVLRE